MHWLVVLIHHALLNCRSAVSSRTGYVPLSTLSQVLLDLIQWQVHHTTLIDTGESSVAKHTLHGFARRLPLCAEWIFASSALFLVWPSAIEARETDSLTATWTILRIYGQVGAVRAAELLELLVASRVKLSELTLDIFHGGIDTSIVTHFFVVAVLAGLVARIRIVWLRLELWLDRFH